MGYSRILKDPLLICACLFLAFAAGAVEWGTEHGFTREEIMNSAPVDKYLDMFKILIVVWFIFFVLKNLKNIIAIPSKIAKWRFKVKTRKEGWKVECEENHYSGTVKKWFPWGIRTGAGIVFGGYMIMLLSAEFEWNDMCTYLGFGMAAGGMVFMTLLINYLTRLKKRNLAH